MAPVVNNQIFYQFKSLTFLQLYKIIVRSCLKYGNIIWGQNKVDEGLKSLEIPIT